jgi:ABC-type branched-subunit amino acid transport system ATPase component
MTLLTTEAVSRRYGGVLAVAGVDLSVEAGSVHGLIGPNGAGKTTLVKLISGEISPTSGRILWRGQDLTKTDAARRSRAGIARTFQNIRLFGRLSALDNVRVAAIAHGAQHPLDEAATALERVGLPRDQWNRSASQLPYMPQRLIEIARACATRPALLLLDEPAAGANADERVALANVIRQLAADGITILLIEHDVDFVFSLATVMSVLDQGRVIASGDSAAVRTDQAVIDAYLGAELE